MKNSFTGLAVAEIEKLKAVVKYIEGYAGKEVVQEIIKKSFKGLAIAEREKLKAVVEYIENYFESADAGKEVVQEIMKNSFTGLAVAEREKLKAVVEYIEGYASKEVVQEIMKKSFYGLAVAEREKLKSIIGYIEKYIDTENERKTTIQQIMTSVSLFATEFHLKDEPKEAYLIFDKLNDLFKSIDESITSTKYDVETRQLWQARLKNIFLNFSIEALEKLHEDIKGIECTEALS